MELTLLIWKCFLISHFPRMNYTVFLYDRYGLKFISTPYDIESAKFLNNTLGYHFKISVDIVDIPLLEYVGVTKSVILSKVWRLWRD